jgi:hypothetical protein
MLVLESGIYSKLCHLATQCGNVRDLPTLEHLTSTYSDILTTSDLTHLIGSTPILST